VSGYFPFPSTACSPSRTAFTLTLLHRWTLSRDGRPLRVAKPAQRLTALIALAGPHEPQYLAGRLWPESSESQAQANLRSTLSRLHSSRIPIIHRDQGLLTLDRGLAVDVQEFSRSADAVIRAPETALSDSAVVQLLQAGDLLTGWYDDWVLTWRERLRQLRMHALEVAAMQLAAAGRYSQALQAGLVCVDIEPLRESAHRVVMEVHLHEGNTLEAVRQFRRYRELVRLELGVEPSAKMAQLLRSWPCTAGWEGAAARCDHTVHRAPGRGRDRA
jgi:DNA-binding SARP family transcriptional activator